MTPDAVDIAILLVVLVACVVIAVVGGRRVSESTAREYGLRTDDDDRDRHVFEALTRPRSTTFTTRQAAVIVPVNRNHDPRLHHTAGGTRKGHES